MKALLRIPSKAIQYGYAEVEISYEGGPEKLAEIYLEYVSKFQITEMDTISGKTSKPEPKAEPEGSDDTDEAARTVTDQLPATVVTDAEAPWEKAEETKAEGNPWDKEPEFDGFDFG